MAGWEDEGATPARRQRFVGFEDERHQRDLGRERIAAFLYNASDSASLGFGDEAKGVLAGAGAALQGNDFGEAYRQSVSGSRDRLNDARALHPMSSLAGSLGGGLAFGGALGAGLKGAGLASGALRNLGPMQRVGAAALSGAGFGGAYGAGSADYGNRVTGGLTGAALGGVTGGAFQAAGAGLGHIYRNMIRTGVPEERAAIELAKALERTGKTPEEIGATIAELRQAAIANPSLNPMVMDALGDAGTDTTMAASTRASAERNLMRADLDARNMGARERIMGLIDENLGTGLPRSGADIIQRLSATKRAEAKPLYDAVYAKQLRPEQIPRVGEIIRRNPEIFEPAEKQARLAYLSETGIDTPNPQDPRYWHLLLQKAEEQVGARLKAAGTDPLKGYTGESARRATITLERFNHQVRSALGPDFRKAQDIWSGSTRNQEAVERGYDVVATGANDMKLGELSAWVRRARPGEIDHMRAGAIAKLRDMLDNADPGTGRANVVRSIMRSEGQKRILSRIFGGEEGLAKVIESLELEQRLFQNTVQSGIRVNSITADKYFGNQQMFAATPGVGNPLVAVREAFQREAKERFDEQMANQVLSLMRTPLTSPDAADLQTLGRTRGLLGRALRERQRMIDFRRKAGPNAFINGAVSPLGERTADYVGG